jgi:hypothetical protein
MPEESKTPKELPPRSVQAEIGTLIFRIQDMKAQFDRVLEAYNREFLKLDQENLALRNQSEELKRKLEENSATKK